MALRRIELDMDSLLSLLTHYSEGEFPLEAKVVGFQVSQRLPRWINLIVDSKDWNDTPFETGDGYGGQQPMFIRYEGKRVMCLQHLKDPIAWSDENEIETPTRQ